MYLKPHISFLEQLENLLLGCRPDITEEDVIEACQIAEIDQEIANLPLQFETKLDENAKILSGGQNKG